MADQSLGSRWNHLLREIPNQSVAESQQESLTQEDTPVDQEEAQDSIYSVSEINKAIKDRLEGDFPNLWIQGEISNFKAHSSGHHYFSLKDEKSQISAVMFKGYNSRLKFRPESGMEVLVRGKVSVYQPRGNYQIFCEHMEPVGAGALQKAFEQLKSKLSQEGLFDEARKKTIPSFPKKVGVVTSPTGAAIQDILNVLGRRSKRVEVVVLPARVQGEGAAQEVVRGIEWAQRLSDLDVLIVGRGGGSIEDLWCFNEEIVARAIASSTIPIISAVGHEVDFTISDFVADKRAPTPSAAAELVAKSEEELIEKLKFYSRSLRLLQFQIIEERRKQSVYLSRRLKDPRKIVEDALMRLEELRQRLIQSVNNQFKNLRSQTQLRSQRLDNPQKDIEKRQNQLQHLAKLQEMAMEKNLMNLKNRFVGLTSLLDSLSPLKVVERGYAITRIDGRVVTSVNQMKKDKLEIEMRDGFVDADIVGIRKKEKS